MLFWNTLKFYKNFTKKNLKSIAKVLDINYSEINSKYKKKVLFLWWEQIKGSISPFMHNFSSNFLSKNNIKYILTPALKTYLDTNKKDSKDIVKEFIKYIESKKNIVWANITMPYKIDMFDYLVKNNYKLEKSAILAGAINTIFKENNKIIWKNTDTKWVTNPISNKIDLSKINTVYILGAWWAGKAVIASMIMSWVKNINILNRNKNKLEAIKSSFDKFLNKDINQNIKTHEYDVSSSIDLDTNKNSFLNIFSKNKENPKFIIINTLPFWFDKNLPKYPILEKELDILLKNNLKNNNFELYFEAVYSMENPNTPFITKIIKSNKDIKEIKNTIKICVWTEMLIWQAWSWFESWTKWWEFKENKIKNILL